MSLLETLISQAIRNATGYDARRVIRKIGTRNILLAGGAALAGGLATQWIQQQRAGGRPSAPGWAPPPPPPPVPPPVPPVGAPLPEPQAPATPAVALPSALPAEPDLLPDAATFPILRAMIAAALADGRMSAEERRAIHEELSTCALGEEQTAQIHRDLVLPASPEEIADFAAAPEAREVLYRFAALALVADREASEVERAWLDRLANALALPAERRAEIESEIPDLAAPAAS